MKKNIYWILGAVDQLINRVDRLEKQLSKIDKNESPKNTLATGTISNTTHTGINKPIANLKLGDKVSIDGELYVVSYVIQPDITWSTSLQRRQKYELIKL